ncbi:MAG TPA: amino acid permease [Planctomycetota bacterium]|nr:amino acid permease [Planctomycetota bacterium]
MADLARSLFRRRSIAELHAEGERSGLKRALGPVDLVMLGVGAVVGAGIFGTIGQAAAAAGPAVMISFVLTAVACALAGLCYAELTSIVPIAGSAYTYAYATLGQLVAWVIGWDLILEYAIGNVGVAISWADYARSFLGELGVDFPIWLAQDPRALTDASPDVQAAIRSTAPHIGGQPICFNLLAVSITVLITWLLVRGVKESARVNNAIVMLKLGVLLFVVGVGLTTADFGRWGLAPYDAKTFAPNGWDGIAKAAGLLFFSYIGFDAVSTAAEETKRPGRDLPIGILGSLVLCTVLYIAIGGVATALMPYQELRNTADPLAVAVKGSRISWAPLVVSAGATLSMTAVLLVFQMGQPRILMSMSRDGLLPPLYARIHPKYRTPAVSTILTGLVVCSFSAFANIAEIVNLVNIGTLFAFVVVCIGTLVLRWRHPELKRPFRAPLLAFVAPAGVLLCIYLMAQLGPENWARLALWLVVGLNVYFAYGFPRNAATAEQAERVRRTACVVFAVVIAAVALFLWKGDEWMSSRTADGKTAWDVWVGFPPVMAHGMALFLAAIVVWNVAGAAKGRARAARAEN